ncbi:MAG: sodium:calcium antiporter [bacterium]
MHLGAELALTVLSLAMILIAAEVFTNAVEWLGVRLRLDSGVVGSILAAVGTAMPETIIPVVAIAKDISTNRLHSPEGESQAIGMGAIIGAPFMLATLAFCIVGLTYYISRNRKTRPTAFTASPRVFRTDIEFFLVAFSIGVGMGLINHFWQLPYWITAAVGLCTIVLYIYYVLQMFRLGEQEADNVAVDDSALDDHGEHGEELHPLWLTRWYLGPKTEPKKRFIVVQLGVALMLMFFGAHMFVEHLSPLALAWGIDPLILALLITPVATELPEKFNSVLWVSRGKDTLALGNISGALVFQSTFPVAIGLWFLDWNLGPGSPAFIGSVLGLAGALLVYVGLRRSGKIQPRLLLAAGSLYLLYILIVGLHIGGVIHLDVAEALIGNGGH